MRDWAETRKMGKQRFVLMFGVLFWGGLMGLVFPLLQYFLIGKPITVAGYIISIIIFPISGYFVGNFIWRKNEDSAESSSD